MSASTTDKPTQSREAYTREITLAASAIIFAGCFVNYNSSGAAVDATDAASRRFAGIALEYRSQAAGDTKVLVAYGSGQAYKMAATGLAAGDEGKAVFLVDNQTVGLAGATTYGIYVGRIVQVISATSAWIQLDVGGAPNAFDTITERTSAAGVTIDGVRLKDGVNEGTLYASNVFVSSVQTATGSAQNVAHGFGVTPVAVFAAPVRGHNGAGAVGDKMPELVAGTHTSTNCVFTAEAGSQYRVLAFK